MKNIKNIHVLYLTIFIMFSSCKNVKNNDNEKIQKVLTTYITQKVNNLQEKELNKIVVDSVVILYIDTLTDQSLLRLKYNAAQVNNARYERMLSTKENVFKVSNELDQIRSNLGLWTDTSITKLNDKEIQEMSEKIEINNLIKDSIRKLDKSKLDSITLRFYNTYSRVVFSKSNSTKKSFEIPIILTKDYRIQNFEDLVKR